MARRVPLPLRQLPWRTGWLLRNQAFRSSPFRTSARLVSWTTRELFQEELEFTTREGRRIRTMRNNVSGLCHYVSGHYESELIDFMKTRLCCGSTFVDIGANVGLYSVEASSIIGPDGRILALEAHPYTYKFLEENVKRHCGNRVTALNVAVGEIDGQARFTYETRNPGSSHIATECDSTSISVPMQRLDNIVEEQGIERVHYLKLDVEGFEPSVLRGATRTLERNESLVLQIEINRHLLGRFGFSPDDVAAPLIERGFLPYELASGGLREIPSAELAFGDIIWMRK
jgi:FkbM family methyltransferase